MQLQAIAQNPHSSPLLRFGVGQKLVLATSALLAVLIVSGIVTFRTDLDLATISQKSEASARALSLTGYLNNFGARQKYIANDFLLTQRDFDRKSYEEASEGFTKARRDLQDIFTRDEPELLTYLNAYGDLHDIWQSKVGDEEFRLGADPAQAEQGRALLKSDLSQSLSDRSRVTGTALGKATQEWAERWTEACRRQLSFLKTVIVCGVLTGIVVAALIGWLLGRAISKPLVSMTIAMKRLATGDLGVAVPAVGRKDEIGDMAGAVQVFKDAAAEKRRLELESDVLRQQQAEAERLRIEKAEAEAAQRQNYALDAVASGLADLSNGDLTSRLKDAFAPQYEKLRADFNAAMDKLLYTMNAVATNTAAIRSGTAEISSASDDLSRRTEQQAASLEETAAALDEITATVKKTSDGSIHARTVVSNTKADAERSGTVVGQAIEAMSAIEQSAQKVTQIIGVIDEIAFQTNLLALNAGVEAARAGEAGRGFAVVASEVRALAQRSAEAAKEIKALISTSSQQVSTGVGLVNETGDALKRIVSQVAEINAVVSDIATSTQEQATALQEVNTAINQMDQVTQQNAAMVEQSTAASKNLASETEQLGRLVGQFELGQKAGGGRPSGTRAQARPAATKVAALKTTGHGGAARKPEPMSESWEEF